MNRWAAAAVLVWCRAAEAQGIIVSLDDRASPLVGERIARELRALGHTVVRASGDVPDAARVRLDAATGALRARVEVPGRQGIWIDLRPHPDERGTGDVLRVVEAIAGMNLAVPEASRPSPTRAEGPRWYQRLRGSVGGAVLASPGGATPMPALWLRLSWESTLCFELVGVVALAEASFEREARLRASGVSFGVGAPLIQGSPGSLGLSLRGGAMWVQATGGARAEGVAPVVEAALHGRLRLWQRLAVVGGLTLGTTLGAVRVTAGESLVGEWGRPYLLASLGLSY